MHRHLLVLFTIFHAMGPGSGCSGSSPDPAPTIRHTPPPDGGNGGDASTSPSNPDARGQVDGPERDAPATTAPHPDGGPPLCRPDTRWGAATVVPVSTDEARFAAITPDELTIAWTSTFEGLPILHYADRRATPDPFGDDLTIAATADYFAADRVAVSPDGLRIVVVRSDRKGFGEFIRTARFGEFTQAPSAVAFAQINAKGQTLSEDESFGDPIVSADDFAFYFSQFGGDLSSTIYEAVRSGSAAWPVGTAVAGDMLKIEESKRRRPTGISSDRLTLFYWDESSSSERAAFRPDRNWPFDSMIELQNRAEAQPNAGCTQLYFSTAGVRPEIVVAPSN